MRYKAGDARKYEGMDMSPVARRVLEDSPALFKSWCNGVGSRGSFWDSVAWHFIPNTIWFMDITKASDIHDVEWTIPTTYTSVEEARKAWLAANCRFVRNCRKLAFDKDGMFLKARLHRIKWYGAKVGSEKSFQRFLRGKTILNK